MNIFFLSEGCTRQPAEQILGCWDFKVHSSRMFGPWLAKVLLCLLQDTSRGFSFLVLYHLMALLTQGFSYLLLLLSHIQQRQRNTHPLLPAELLQWSRAILIGSCEARGWGEGLRHSFIYLQPLQRIKNPASLIHTPAESL